MIVKSLRYNKFRQFKFENTIEFSCDKDKNVTIILGNNTYGKTTLLQMFNWCFYNKAIFNDNPNFLLNYEISKKMFNGDTRNVEVEIILEHDNNEYSIFRKQEYMKLNGKVIGKPSQLKITYKDLSTGITYLVERESDMNSIINTILPEELSGYFFFDTERVQNVSERKDLTKSVQGLLGLTVLDNTIKHLGKRESKTTVIGSFYSDLNLNDNKKADDALDKVQLNEESAAELKNGKENCEYEISQYERKCEILENKIRDNENTTELQNLKDKLVRNINSEKDALEKSYNSYIKEFSSNSMNFFSQPLLGQASEFLKESDVDDKGIKDVTAQSIMEIMKRGTCLCGTRVVEGNEAYEHLMDELKFVPPESIGTTIRNFKKDIDLFNAPNKNNRFFVLLEDYMKDILRYKSKINELEDEITEIEKEIEGKEDSRKYQKQLNVFKQTLRDLQGKNEDYIGKIAYTEGEIERFKKVYDGLTASSEKNKEIREYLAYAEEINTWISNHYKEKEKLIREELEKRVNDIFSRMYHGERKVVIDDKYQTTLLTLIGDEEIETGESEGLLRVKNFAFIAGLVDLAKSKILDVDGQDLGNEPYPLILDAPFSNTDEVHIRNISRELPKVAEQVIMFVMEKDWKYAELVILDKVDKQYNLEKHSDTYTTIS